MFQENQVIYRYKYLPFDEGSLKTITEGTIKFANALDFNDPFDCHPHFDVENIAELPKLKPELFKAAGDRRGLNPAQRLVRKGEFLARLRESIHDGSFRRGQIERIGVVSLSRNGKNVLMWSHYAGLHRGFMLEFRIPVFGTSSDSIAAMDRLLPFPVKYQSARPSIKIGHDLPDDLVERILLTKSRDWAYEQEERVVYQGRSPGIYAYRRDEILASVVAGLKMPTAHRQELEMAVNYAATTGLQGLALYDAKEEPRAFGITVPGHPRLG
jgi:hypothetical protein